MIERNIRIIREKISDAAIKAGRDPSTILLCAATKMNDVPSVRAAIQAGVDCCGENRVQEFLIKNEARAYTGAPVHFIGHLQTNKVNNVVGFVDLIQSVDSIRLLNAIQKCAFNKGITQDILLEINIGNEATKSGFLPSEIFDLCEKLSEYTNIRTKGLMTIPPKCQIPGENNKFFQEMYNLAVDITTKKYDNIRVDILSMGMSDDFADAIACGSTMVRIGTGIFGPRNYQ